MSTTQLADYCCSIILRHFRENSLSDAQAFESPQVSLSDVNELQKRWSLSPSVETLAQGIINNPNLLFSSLREVVSNTTGELTGEIHATDSVLLQLRTGDYSQFVVSEATPTYLNGPNHIVAWVLNEAHSQLETTIRKAKNKIPSWVHEKKQLINKALKNQIVSELTSSEAVNVRPSAEAKRVAFKSRNILYKQSLNALRELELIEALDISAIKSLLNVSLLSPLEDWQLLELSAALSALQALAEKTNETPIIKLRLGSEKVVGSVGNFDVVWQNTLPQRNSQQLDSSEKMAKSIANYIGSDISQSRVDISIFDHSKGKDISHFECKFTNNEAYVSQAISDAALQITRYVRDSRPNNQAEVDILLKNSLIIVSQSGKFKTKTDGKGPIGFTDFNGLASGALLDWAERLVTS